MSNTITLNPAIGQSPQNVITISPPPNPNGYTIASSPQGLLDLRGEGADIVINGVSLNETLKGIQERLNILTVNHRLEAKWVELKLLGDQYRALEAELLAKQKMWDTLKK